MQKPRILPSLSTLTADQRQLAEQWLPYCQGEASRRSRSRQEQQDLFAEFELALLRCAVRFQPARGKSFLTLLATACANAAISLHRKHVARAECALTDRHLERDSLPPLRAHQVAPAGSDVAPPTAHDLAKAAVLAELRAGSLYRVAVQQGRRFLPGLHVRQAQRWAYMAGIKRGAGRRKIIDPTRLKKNRHIPRSELAKQLGVSRETVWRCCKKTTHRHAVQTVAASKKGCPMADTRQKPTINANRLRAQLAAHKRTQSALAAQIGLSERHLTRLLSTGAWTPVQINKLKRALGPEAWEFVTERTKRIAG